MAGVLIVSLKCLPLSGSFMIGIIRLFSVLFCSFSRNSDVDAICRSASIPSIILLLDCCLFSLFVGGGYFG